MIDLAMGLGVELGGQNNGDSTENVSRETPITGCHSIACVSLDNADDVTARNNVKNLLNGVSDRFRQSLPISGADTSRLDGKLCQTGAQKSQTSLCLTDLERQREEFEQEMEVELALVQGELESECAELETEQRIKEKLCTRIAGLGQTLQAEKEKEKAKVDCARRKMEEARARLHASQQRFEDQPESAKEQLREQLQEEADAVDLAHRSFEDLEFQYLEKVSSLEEERETQNLQLQRELEQCEQRETDRKERVRTLQQQMLQIKEQAKSEGQRLTERWEEALGSYRKEDRTVFSWAKSDSGGGGSGIFPDSTERMKQALDFVTQRGQAIVKRANGDLRNSTPCVLSVTKISATNTILQDPSLCGNGFGSLRRRRSECSEMKDSERPVSLHEKGLGLAPMQLLSLVALHRSNSFRRPKATLSCSPPGDLNTTPPGVTNGHGRQRSHTGGSTTLSRAHSLHSNGCSLQTLAEMEQKLREALEEKERLLQVREAQRKAKIQSGNAVMNGDSVTSCDPPESALLPAQAEEKSPSVQQAPISPVTFNLRAHVEACGHGVEACRQLTLTERACRGFLTKMGGRIKTWKKRWFVFDSLKRRLAYFADKGEAKLKGVIYFQAIEEVYFDHLRRAPKSPNPPLTFCLKTYDRLYYLVAPTDVSLRIWMEVVLTAMEGDVQF